MKRNDSILILSLTMIIVIVIAVVSVFYFFPVRLSGKMECSFNNIEYKNITPFKCWSNSIASDYCPLPKDISCDVEGSLPVTLATIMMAEMD